MVGWIKAIVIGVSIVVAAGSALIVKMKRNPPIVTEIVEDVEKVADEVIKEETGVTVPFVGPDKIVPVETDSNSTGTEDKVS